MKIPLLYRVVFKEVSACLVLGILLLAGVLFATSEFSHILNLICVLGIRPDITLFVTILQIPTTLIYSLPAALLIAAALTLNRMSRAHELAVLSISGIDARRVLIPIFFAGLALSICSFFLAAEIAPRMRESSKKLFVSAALNCDLPLCQNSLTIVQDEQNDGKPERILLIARYLQKSLEKVVVFDLTKSPVSLVVADRGIWEKGRWCLLGGRIYNVPASGEKGAVLSQRFQSMSFDGIGEYIEKFSEGGVLPPGMTNAKLFSELDRLKSKGEKIPPDLLLTAFRRFTQPLSCLIILLCVLPLLQTKPKKTYFFGLAYVGSLTLAFFISQQAFYALARNNILSPFIASILPLIAVSVPALLVTLWQNKRG